MSPILRFPEYVDKWKIFTIEELSVEVIDGDRGTNYPSKNELKDEGDCLFLSAKNVTKDGFALAETQYISEEKDNQLRKGKLNQGDIVLTTRGTVGNVAHYDEKIMEEHVRINSGMVILRNKNPKLRTSFLYKNFFSEAVRKHIKKVLFGSAQPALTVAEIKKFKIGFTSPEEQQKIADFLMTVDKKISLLKEKHALLAQYKKGVMQKLFKQEIRFKDDSGSDFPDWQWKQGNEVFDAISNKSHNSDLPILAITQEHGAIPRDFINYQVQVTDGSVASYKVVEEGDYIISLRSFQGGIEYSRYKGICSPAYIILRPSISIDDDFYRYYLKTGKFIQEMKRRLEGIRDGKILSYKYFSEIKLPYPCIEEQRKISQFINTLDKKISLVKEQIELTQTFKKGLLQQMFV